MTARYLVAQALVRQEEGGDAGAGSLAVRLCLPDAEAHPPDEGKDARSDRDDTGDSIFMVPEQAVDNVCGKPDPECGLVLPGNLEGDIDVVEGDEGLPASDACLREHLPVGNNEQDEQDNDEEGIGTECGSDC